MQALIPHFFFLIPPLFGVLILFTLYHRIRGTSAVFIALISILLVIPGFFIQLTSTVITNGILLPRENWQYTTVFLIIINSTAVLALLYAWREEAEHTRSSNYYAFILLFIASMNLTVLANHFILFVITWETVLISSALLIANWGKVDNCRVIARKYFIISQAASLCIIAALILLANTGKVHDFSSPLTLSIIPESVRHWIILLLAIGFFTKLAVFPLHIWLPDAHTAAAMPVTILLACAMLPLGVYGILRIGVGLLGIETIVSIQLILLSAGLLTKLFGAIMAARSSEFKRVIAYSSISQAGIFLIGIGLCLPQGFAAATFHVLIHAPIKALLFITMGEVIERSGHITVEAAQIPIQTNRSVFLAYALAAAALAGLPPLVGFSSEWFLAVAGFQINAFWVITIMLFLSIFTGIYLVRVMMNAFTIQKHHPLPPPNRHNERAVPVLIIASAIIIIQSIFAQPIYQWLLSFWGGA